MNLLDKSVLGKMLYDMPATEPKVVEMTGLKPHVVAVVMRDLEKEGWVQRRTDSACASWELTDQGEGLKIVKSVMFS